MMRKIDTVELFDEYHLNKTIQTYTQNNLAHKDRIIDYWSRFYSKYLLFFQMNPSLPVNDCQIRMGHLLTGEYQWLIEESFSDLMAVGIFREDDQVSLVTVLNGDVDKQFKMFIVGFGPDLGIYDVHYRLGRFSESAGEIPFLETEGINLSPDLFNAQRSRESMIPLKLLSLDKTLNLKTQQVYPHART